MKIRFTREELDTLNGKARRAGLSRESYCRHILNGAEVKEAPPADVPTLIREVRRVGCNIDQLLVIARAKNWMIAKDLEKALERSRAVEKLIMDTYTPPLIRPLYAKHAQKDATVSQIFTEKNVI